MILSAYRELWVRGLCSRGARGVPRVARVVVIVCIETITVVPLREKSLPLSLSHYHRRDSVR